VSEPDPWRDYFPRLGRLLRRRLEAADPVALIAEAVLVLLGAGLVGVALAGLFGGWHEVTMKVTTGSTPSMVTTNAAWSDALIGTLLGGGLVLLLAGVFYNRVTAITLPGGAGITLGSAQVAASLAKTARDKPQLLDPRIFERAFLEALANYESLVTEWSYPTVRGRSTVAELTYAASPRGRDPATPDSLADVAVEQALSDLGL
jgi:putative intracellular protease/amidase